MSHHYHAEIQHKLGDGYYRYTVSRKCYDLNVTCFDTFEQAVLHYALSPDESKASDLPFDHVLIIARIEKP